MTKKSTIMLNVNGMTCIACENRIENGLSKIDGVNEVKSNFTTGKVKVTFDSSKISSHIIEQKLLKLDYPVIKNLKDSKAFRLKKQRIQFAVIVIIVIALYLIIENTVGFYNFPMPDKKTSMSLLFFIGLATSVHCVGMCGGINISQCVSNKMDGSESKFGRFFPSLMYNSGRVVSYTVIGGIVGAIGSIITPSGGFRGVVSISAGVFMVLMGINMVGIFPSLRKLMPRMPRFIAKKVNTEKIGKGPFVVGLLNGLMPCGPLQNMQIYALLTGSALLGALSMFLFSIGTVPLMFLLGALSSVLSSKFTQMMSRVSAVLVIILGLIMMNSGLVLSGYNPLF